MSQAEGGTGLVFGTPSKIGYDKFVLDLIR